MASEIYLELMHDRYGEELERTVAKALRESGQNRPAPVSSRGGDARAMRGVPISAVGVPGTLPGTDPEQEACR